MNVYEVIFHWREGGTPRRQEFRVTSRCITDADTDGRRLFRDQHPNQPIDRISVEFISDDGEVFTDEAEAKEHEDRKGCELAYRYAHVRTSNDGHVLPFGWIWRWAKEYPGFVRLLADTVDPR